MGEAPANSVGKVIRGVATLSLGTIAVQSSSMLGQVLLAFWLTPADFGHWAAATSFMAVVSGLINLGEINGYLANPARSYLHARAAIWRINLLLVLAGLALAVLAARLTNSETALLIVCLTLMLPLTGHSALLTAVYLRSRNHRRIVAAQGLAAVGRLGVGIATAWFFHSALAFAAATATYCLTLIWYLSRHLKSDELSGTVTVGVATVRDRARWAVYSIAQYIPGQIDYLVLTFASSAATLGVYYLAFQITVGISGLVAGPLAKTSLASMAILSLSDQKVLFTSLATFTTGVVIVVSAVCAGVLLSMQFMVPTQWSQVPFLAAILLASLPCRFLSPLTDARLMASKQWSKGTIYGSIDILGTGAAASVILIGTTSDLALAVVGWKLLYGVVRFFLVTDPSSSRWERPIFTTLLTGATIALALAPLMADYLTYLMLTIAALLGAVLLTGESISARRNRRSSWLRGIH